MKKLPFFLTIAFLLAMPVPAQARLAKAAVSVPYHVTSSADTDDGACTASNCTLREAIHAGNASANAGNYIEVYFDFDGTIVLGSPLPAITNTPAYIDITGSGHTVRISGANQYPIFTVNANAMLELQLLTISYAHAGSALNNAGTVLIHKAVFSNNTYASGSGGAIFNSGWLDISDTTFSYNQADYGGAIYNNGSSATLQVNTSTFDHNSAIKDGGAIHQGSGTSRVTNSTFTLNSAPDGAAIMSGSGWTVYLNNSTVVGNQGLMVAPHYGGSLTNASGSGFHIRNSIVGVAMTGVPCYPLGGSNFTNDGNNIDRGLSCGFGSDKGSLSSTDPQLLALANNGGVTMTMALQKTSPAVDGVTYMAPNQCPLTDQRGIHRPIDGNQDGIARCDIGAFELQQVVYLPLLIR